MGTITIHAPFSSAASIVIWIAAGILFAMIFCDYLNRREANRIYDFLKSAGADEMDSAVDTEKILSEIKDAGRYLKKAKKSAYMKRFIGKIDHSDNKDEKNIDGCKWYIKSDSSFLKRNGETSLGKFIVGAVFLFIFALLIDLFFDTIVGLFVSSRNLFNLFE